jgi:hypothetical protein
MATAQAALTPASNTTPAVVSVPAGVPSGAAWVAQYPSSSSVSDCAAPFKANLTAFIAALNAAGATVNVSATLRPAERAYLMHWCWSIVNANADPKTIPALAGVNIAWAHTNAQGAYDAADSTAGAQAMVNAYGMQNLQVAPALNSKHISGLAVDMSIAWTGDLTINNKSGTAVVIKTAPRTGMNTDLHAVGATYDVIKYVGGEADKPHWSDDGH